MNQLTVALIVVIGLLGGFYSGFKYGQGHPPPAASTPQTQVAGLTGGGGGSARGGAGNGGGGGGSANGGGGGAFGSAISGQITAVSAGQITIHDANTGKDVKVNIGQARISKTAQGSAADLTPSETVTVVGPTGADGTMNASVVSIGGGFQGGGRRGAPTASPATTS